MIVGLTGFAQSGKDTAAKALLDIGYERRAFADPLRECLYVLNPIISAQAIRTPITKDNATGLSVNRLRLADCVDAVGWDEAKKLTEVRRLLQVFGTEVVRDHFGRETWTNYLRDSMQPGVDYVITDVRFDNEVECVHRMGGIVVRITRPGVGPVNAHASDAVDGLPVDYTIDNNGSVEGLHKMLLDLVQ
jgi:hypothetical protein